MVELLEFGYGRCALRNKVGSVEVSRDSVVVRKTIGDVYVWFVIREDGSVEVFSYVGDVKVAKKETVKVKKYMDESVICKGVRLEFETKRK